MITIFTCRLIPPRSTSRIADSIAATCMAHCARRETVCEGTVSDVSIVPLPFPSLLVGRAHSTLLIHQLSAPFCSLQFPFIGQSVALCVARIHCRQLGRNLLPRLHHSTSNHDSAHEYSATHAITTQQARHTRIRSTHREETIACLLRCQSLAHLSPSSRHPAVETLLPISPRRPYNELYTALLALALALPEPLHCRRTPIGVPHRSTKSCQKRSAHN